MMMGFRLTVLAAISLAGLGLACGKGNDAAPADAASGGTGAGGATGPAGASGGGGAGGMTGEGAGGNGTGGRGTGGSGSGGAAAGGNSGGGGSNGTGGVASYIPCPALPAPCKILPFGDSITFGVGSAPPSATASNGGYRVELFHRAHQDGKSITFVGTAVPNGPAQVDGVAFPTEHEGHSGFTIVDEAATPTLAARQGIAPLVPTVMSATRPDIVALMIGTNDVQHDYDVANAPARLAALIDALLATDPHLLVVVAQIPPTTDATLNPAIETYNAAIAPLVAQRAAAGKHVLLVDVYHAIASDPLFVTTSGRVVADPTVGLMFDWLHPHAAGYVRVGDAWYTALKTSLR